MRPLFFLLLSLLALHGVARADENPMQSLDDIRHAAETQLRSRLPAAQGSVFVSAGELDPRLRLHACSRDLAAFIPAGTQIRTRTTVGVKCADEAAWTIYVPVNVESEIPVLVLRTPALRGAHLTAADVEQQHRRVPGIGSAYISNAAALERQSLKRALPAGSVLTPDMLTADKVVKRGQQVMLVAEIGGIEVRANGVALSDGGLADRVRVQNSTSLKIVEGVVDVGNVVRVE